MTIHSLIDTPLGEVVLQGDGRALTGLRFAGAAPPPGRRDDAALAEPARQGREYFAGERPTFDVPLATQGSEFERAVWAALGEIPYGHTVTYGELAARLGH